MILPVQIKIRNDPRLYQYLREKSYWYKELNRNSNAILQMEQEMKERYQLTALDKINQLSKQLELVRSFMDMMR